jgi:hypothetical protein
VRAGVERLVPLAVGLAAGCIGFVAAPNDAAQGLFGAIAQIVPVLLLALVLEARIFGGPVRRQPEQADPGVAIALGYARKTLEYLTVAALVAAEWQAVHTVAIGEGGDPRWVYASVTWALVTIAILAAVGARPRITASISWRPDARRWIVELGLGNVYGDKDVEPIVNFLVPKGHSIDECDQEGRFGEPPGPHSPHLLATTEAVDGEDIEFDYVGRRVVLTPGDSALTYYSVCMNDLNGDTPEPMMAILRADHAELPRGREELRAMLDPNRPGSVTSSGST